MTKRTKKAEVPQETFIAESDRTAISSDDPDAVAKLDEKIAKLEARQERMKAVNKVVRSAAKAGITGPSVGRSWDIYLEALRKIPGVELINAEGALAFLKPDFCGRIGYADFETTNNNANIRRLKERRAALEKTAQAEEKEYAIGEARVLENVEENRMQLFFPDKPPAEVRAKLKQHGFRWSPNAGAWQRQLNNSARYAAEYALGKPGS